MLKNSEIKRTYSSSFGNVKIPIVYDVCTSTHYILGVFKKFFGEQIFETSIVDQGLSPTLIDTEIRFELNKKIKGSYVLVTTNNNDKFNFSNSYLEISEPSLSSQKNLVITFARTYKKEEKKTLLERLFRTRGFKNKNINFWISVYEIIKITKNFVEFKRRNKNDWVRRELKPLLIHY